MKPINQQVLFYKIEKCRKLQFVSFNSTSPFHYQLERVLNVHLLNKSITAVTNLQLSTMQS